MKAVVYDRTRSPDRLVLREVEKPVPSDDEVLVKIHAVSVNAADYRSMKFGIIPKRKIFGADIAGRVEAVGAKAKDFVVGDEVLGDLATYGFGGFAEYVAAPEGALARKPTGIPFEVAAAVPLAAVTALQALRKGSIQPDQKVLICGAGGGVGTFAVQLARDFGAHVTAVCSAANMELVRSLGAERVIDYRREDFAVDRNHYDLLLAINGNRSLFTYRRVLAPKGTYVMVGGAVPQVIGSLLFGPLMSIGNKRMLSLSKKASKTDLEHIIKLVYEGRIRPIIDRRYPLSATAEAVRLLAEGHARGKVVIDVSA